jgi:hypothetical protein
MVAMPQRVATLQEAAPDHLAPKPTGERAALEAKLPPVLLERYDCWKKRGSDCELAEDGSIEIQIFLTDDSPAVVREIEDLGFSVSQYRAQKRIVIGRIPLGKLADLATVQMVRFITLARRETRP